MTEQTNRTERRRGLAVELETGTVTLQPGETYRPSPRDVDLCFVFDTTGSMSDKIEGLIACMVDLVRELANLSLDWRLAVVPFGDLSIPGDRIVSDRPFVASRTDAEAELRQMFRNNGGNNEGESAIEAMQVALGKPYRRDVLRLLILLTDEPALGAGRASSLETRLRREEVIAFVVSPDLPYYRSWAESTGGTWLPIASAVDTTGVLTLLRTLAARLALVAHEVYALAGGSVSAYRALGRGQPE